MAVIAIVCAVLPPPLYGSGCGYIIHHISRVTLRLCFKSHTWTFYILMSIIAIVCAVLNPPLYGSECGYIIHHISRVTLRLCFKSHTWTFYILMPIIAIVCAVLPPPFMGRDGDTLFTISLELPFDYVSNPTSHSSLN